jgi:hypothetical protein
MSRSVRSVNAAQLKERWLELARESLEEPQRLWRCFLDLSSQRASGCDPDRDGDLLLFEAGRSGDLSCQRQLFEESGAGEYRGMTTYGFSVALALAEGSPDLPAEKLWGNAALPAEFRDAVEETAAFRAWVAAAVPPRVSVW